MSLVAVAAATVDTPFVQERRTAFTVADGLPDDQVTAIFLADDGRPVAVTDAGYARFDGVRWQQLDATPAGAVNPSDPAAGDASAGELCRIELPEGLIFIGADDGLFQLSATGDPKRILPEDASHRWNPRRVRVLTIDSKGRLWFGALDGVGCWDGQSWRLYAGEDGLPYNDFTCAAPGLDGAVWFGTTKGAIRFDGTRFAYRAGLRWLPDDLVNGIVVDPAGTAWFATAGGVSRIERIPMTLEEKADYFVDQVESRHVRLGFVAARRLSERGNVDSYTPHVDDNDGLYTAQYGAAMALRYAATGDERAAELARRSFKSLKWLVDITGNPGFPARVIVPSDWPENLDEEYGHAYNERKKARDPQWKLIYPRYVPTDDGKWLWKCDTSSDELGGHFFFYSIYYDHVAKTDAEKEEVASVVAAMADHLIQNGFNLVDWDGQPTRWGKFSPDRLHSLDSGGDRNLNSLMLLAFMKVAEHVTGDAKYANVSQTLRDQYFYDMNTIWAQTMYPPDDAAPWDTTLAMLAYYPLIQYETDPEAAQIYRYSLMRTWHSVKYHKNHFYNAVYGALMGKEHFAREDTLDTLRGIPLELIGWEMKNSHRLDVATDIRPGYEMENMGWSKVDGKALPIEERYQCRLDRTALVLDKAEGSGWSEHEGTFYLLPYYIARYHGLLD